MVLMIVAWSFKGRVSGRRKPAMRKAVWREWVKGVRVGVAVVGEA